MEILKNLDHPNIIKIYETFEDKENYYVITEYVLLIILVFVKEVSFLIDCQKREIFLRAMLGKYSSKFSMQSTIATFNRLPIETLSPRTSSS
jgi:serine/threonine protein kinase